MWTAAQCGATHSTCGSVADRLQGEREINRESGAVSGCRFLFQEVSDRRGCSSVHRLWPGASSQQRQTARQQKLRYTETRQWKWLLDRNKHRLLFWNQTVSNFYFEIKQFAPVSHSEMCRRSCWRFVSRNKRLLHAGDSKNHQLWSESCPEL